MEHGRGVTIISILFCFFQSNKTNVFVMLIFQKTFSSLCLREACLQIVMIDTKILCKKLCL